VCGHYITHTGQDAGHDPLQRKKVLCWRCKEEMEP
jgi:hypothetical protein